MTKHKYSTGVLIMFSVILIAGFAVATLDTEDLDSVCSIDNALLYRYNGEWMCGSMPQPVVYNTTTNMVIFNGTLLGTANYIPRWLNSTAMTESGLVDNGSRINATYSIYFNDNTKLFWGTNNESSINYNGTNLIYNSIESGTGLHDFNGDIQLDDSSSALISGEYQLNIQSHNPELGDIPSTADGGVVGYWKMDDGSGTTTVDSSGNGYTGTFAGNPTWQGSGYFGYAGDDSIDFDGVGDAVSMGDNDAFSFGDGTNDYPFSVSFWFKAGTQNTNYAPMVAKDDGSAGSLREWAVIVVADGGANDGKLRFFLKDNGGGLQQSIDTTNNTFENDGQWHHVVATYDGRGGNNATDGMNLYVDGQLETPTTITQQAYTAMANTTAHLRFSLNNVNRYYVGELDNVIIYNDVRTAQEVSNDYNTGFAGGTAIILNTNSTYVGVNSKLISIRNNGNEKAYFKKDGGLFTPNIDIASSTVVDGIIDDDTMSTASNTTLATSESIKGYIDAKTISFNTTVSFETYDAEPARGAESNIHGGMLSLASGQTLNSANNISVTKGSGKVILVLNAGADSTGTITLTGDTLDRNTGIITSGDSVTLTIDTLTTDSSDTDTNTNIRHNLTNAYISSKWFVGNLNISTTDTSFTDVDVYHVSFEQFGDQTDITITAFDHNLYTTNANAEYDSYLYCLEVTGDKVNVDRIAEVHVGADGEVAQTNKYWRLRRGNINKVMDGTTDGVWIDTFYTNSPAYVEDVTTKIWALKEQTININ